jgi:hypothetical protein
MAVSQAGTAGLTESQQADDRVHLQGFSPLQIVGQIGRRRATGPANVWPQARGFRRILREPWSLVFIRQWGGPFYRSFHVRRNTSQ